VLIKALESIDVSVSYGAAEPVLTGASFVLKRGELAAVVGPNGAGKSTLFRALAGFVDHEGDVVVNGEKCHHLERESIAYIPQQNEIDLRFPITVEEVVMAGRRRFHRVRMRPTAEDHVKVRACLAEMDLADQSERPLAMLSGGQLQRVLIARALAQEASVLLLDEAMSGVDSSHVSELMRLFGDLCAHGTAILVSTHDLGLVRQQFPRCIAVNGSVLGDGDPTVQLSGELLERLFSRARGAEGP